MQQFFARRSMGDQSAKTAIVVGSMAPDVAPFAGSGGLALPKLRIFVVCLAAWMSRITRQPHPRGMGTTAAARQPKVQGVPVGHA